MTLPSCLEKFKPGTIVTVIATAESYKRGPVGTEYENYEWAADWADLMNDLVGKTFKVKEPILIDNNGIRVSCYEMPGKNRLWNFPPWCLALQDEVTIGQPKSREFEKSELDLIEKFVKFQVEEKVEMYVKVQVRSQLQMLLRMEDSLISLT